MQVSFHCVPLTALAWLTGSLSIGVVVVATELLAPFKLVGGTSCGSILQVRTEITSDVVPITCYSYERATPCFHRSCVELASSFGVIMMGLTVRPFEMPTQLAIPVLCFFVIIGVTSLATNSLIIYLLYKNTHQRRGYNFFLLQNSIADLLCSAICVPFWILVCIYDKQQLADETFCELSAAVSFTQLVASGIFLMQAAAYRHCSLTDKEQVAKTFSITRSRLVVVFTWVLTTLVCVCPNVAWSSRPGLVCAPDLVTHSWYTASVLCFLTALPQGASLYITLYDMCFLRQNSKSAKRRVLTPTSSSRQKHNFTELQGDELMVHRGLFLVILIHALFWLPYISISIIEMLSGGKIHYLDDEQRLPVAFVGLVISLTSAALKGIVYCSENPYMRALFKEQFQCKAAESEDGELSE